MVILKCEICEAGFKSEMALTGHQISVHESREDSYPCKLCPASFSEYNSLTSHITSVHVKPKPYSCLKCSESFMTIQGMMKHITVHENFGGDENKEIKQLESTTNAKRNNKTRKSSKPTEAADIKQEIQSSPQLKKNKNSFLRKEYLNHHKSTHTEEKPFPCTYCMKSFKKRYYLQMHKKVHTGEGFLCKLCGKSFSLAINLKMHERLHTGDKPFSCRHCDQTFSQKINAQGHERTHTGEKPFSCEYCDKRFSRKDTLKNHRRRHTEEKPKCKYCGKEFLCKKSIKKHEENICKMKSLTTHRIYAKSGKMRQGNGRKISKGNYYDVFNSAKKQTEKFP